MGSLSAFRKHLAAVTLALSTLTAATAGAVDVNVQAFMVNKLTCKTNQITWKRPTAASIACGQIARYKVYRNDLLVSVLEGLNGAPLNDLNCPATTYIAPGDSGANVNHVDEHSTHQYKVKVVDVSGVEHTTSVFSTVSSSVCPAGPYTLSLNMTLVTFSDVVNAGCSSYPCVVQAPPGAPFTIAKAANDLYLSSGPNDRAPLAWVLQQNAPNKTISVTGEVVGWVVLKERSHYCPSPYNLPECLGAHTQMIDDAISVRGPMAVPRIDGFFVYGTDSGPYASGSAFATAGQVRFFAKVATGLRTETHFEHEVGHLGLFDSVSARLNAHSYSLRCPGGIAVGPDLRDLSKDASGTPGQCQAFDYGDTYCTMGNQYRMFNAYSRWRLGLIDVSNIYTVWPAATTSTILLEHLNAPSSATSTKMKMIRVALDPNVADTYYSLEYRGGSAWRELDYRAYCPNNLCSGGSVPQGVTLPQGVYLRLRVRNPGDLGTANPSAPGVPLSPNGSIQILALTKETSPGVYQGLYLDMANPVYCDPYRNIKITLLEFTTFGGVDTAKVQVTRNATCP